MARLIYDVLAIIRVTGVADEAEALRAVNSAVMIRDGLEVRESWDAELVSDTEPSRLAERIANSVTIPAPVHVELRELAEGLTEDYDEEVVAHATGKRMLEILAPAENEAPAPEAP